MKTKEDKIIDAIGGLSDKNVMLTDDVNLSGTEEREIAVNEENRSSKISVRRTLFGTAAAAVVLAGGMALRSRITNSLVPFDYGDENSGSSVTAFTETTAENSVTQIKIVEGELLKSEELADFNSDCSMMGYYMDYDKEWAETHDKDIWGENIKGVLDQIGSDEITKLYYRADMLFRLRSSEKLEMFDGYNGHGAKVVFPDQETDGFNYLSSGFNYDSFVSDWHEVFTDECLSEKIDLSGFKKYGDELYYFAGSYPGDITLVHTEYALEKQGDDEIIIKTTEYHDDERRSITDLEEHYAELKASLRKENYQYRFVKTDKGWRIAEFPKTKWK